MDALDALRIRREFGLDGYWLDMPQGDQVFVSDTYLLDNDTTVEAFYDLLMAGRAPRVTYGNHGGLNADCSYDGLRDPEPKP